MLIQGQDEVRMAPADAPDPLPSAAPEGPAGMASVREPVPDAIIMVGGLLCVGVGLMVIHSLLPTHETHRGKDGS